MVDPEDLEFPISSGAEIPRHIRAAMDRRQWWIVLRWYCPSLTEAEAGELSPMLRGTLLADAPLRAAIRRNLPEARRLVAEKAKGASDA